MAVVAGQTQAGQQASSSHTAGLATDARVVRGLLEQAGVIRVRDFTELIHLTRAFSVVATPRTTKRVAVVSTSGAACVLSADLLSEAGLEVATLSPTSESRIAPLLPDPNSVRNPIDVSLASLTHGNDKVIPEVTAALFEDPQVDAALFAQGAFAGQGSWFSPKMLDPGKTDSAKPAIAWSYGPREYLETWYGEFETVGGSDISRSALGRRCPRGDRTGGDRPWAHASESASIGFDENGEDSKPHRERPQTGTARAHRAPNSRASRRLGYRRTRIQLLSRTNTRH